LKKIKKILINVLVLLVLLSNASYAISYTLCKMTKKSVCQCSMTNENNSNTAGEKISSQSNSCCKSEINYISNSSDYESYQKVTLSNISNTLITSNFFQISNHVSANFTGKEVLLFYYIPADIPVRNSTLRI
jgi:hypothetical protein